MTTCKCIENIKSSISAEYNATSVRLEGKTKDSSTFRFTIECLSQTSGIFPSHHTVHKTITCNQEEQKEEVMQCPDYNHGLIGAFEEAFGCQCIVNSPCVPCQMEYCLRCKLQQQREQMPEEYGHGIVGCAYPVYEWDYDKEEYYCLNVEPGEDGKLCHYSGDCREHGFYDTNCYSRVQGYREE